MAHGPPREKETGTDSMRHPGREFGIEAHRCKPYGYMWPDNKIVSGRHPGPVPFMRH